MSVIDACRQTARRTFGIERLRPEQESAIVAFGKSLIYQVPAMILMRPTIVVSPLHCAHGGPGAGAQEPRRPRA